MKRISAGLFLVFFMAYAEGQTIPVYRFSDFEPYLKKNNDTTYIINFWATWCVPCRKELPDFERFGNDYRNKPVKIILVSLDMAEDIDKTLKPFLNKYGIKSKVVLLDDPDSNYWINRVEPSWSGTIPATLIYNKRYREFFPSLLTYEKLDSIININVIKP